MARTSKVWYWEDRKAYYSTIGGKKIKLASTKKAAERALKALLKSPPAKASGFTVDHLLGAFHLWNVKHRAPKTTSRYKELCTSFNERYGHLSVEQVTPDHVTRWLADQSWNGTTQRNAMTSIQRAFNWGVKNTSLRFNPIKGMEKATSSPKRRMISPEEFDTLLTFVDPSDAFYDYLVISYDTGARPKEIYRLEARHLELSKSRATYPVQEAKGQVLRTIYFPTERSMAILKRVSKERPEGPILLNARGTLWNNFNVKCRFARLAEKTGKRWNAYALRHGFGTRSVKAGIDSHVVAKLMGHVDVNMVHTTYSHVADDPEYMLNQAQKGVVD